MTAAEPIIMECGSDLPGISTIHIHTITATMVSWDGLAFGISLASLYNDIINLQQKLGLHGTGAPCRTFSVRAYPNLIISRGHFPLYTHHGS